MSSDSSTSGWKVLAHCVVFFLIFSVSLGLPTLLVQVAPLPDLPFIAAFPLTYFVYYVLLSLPLYFGLSYLVVKTWRKKELKTYHMLPPTRFAAFFGVMGFILPVLVVLVYLGFGIAQMQLSFPDLSGKEIAGLILLSLIPALSGGFIEEMAFRGFVFRELEMKWGAGSAILFTSLPFALIHISTIETAIILNVFFVFAVGVLTGFIVYYTRNIWNAILVHFSWNFVFVGRFFNVGYVNSPVNEEKAFFFILDVKSQNYLWTGGENGMEYGLPSLLVTLAGIALVYRFRENLRL